MRGDSFNKTTIGPKRTRLLMPVSSGQPHYERAHLLAKLRIREPARHRQQRPRLIHFFACATETLRPGSV
jgi:hypothetical protein